MGRYSVNPDTFLGYASGQWLRFLRLLNPSLHLSRLVVNDPDAAGHLTSELDKLLMHGVFEDVVVAVLFVFKFNNEAMG